MRTLTGWKEQVLCRHTEWHSSECCVTSLFVELWMEERLVGEGASEREGSRVMGGEESGVEGSLRGVAA